jgi:hypothetical protein
MAEPGSPSFIPKQNPSKITKTVVARQVYVFSVIAYVLFVAALLSVAGMFLYDRYTDQKLAAAIDEYNTAINTFDQKAMADVIEFGERLRYTRTLLDGMVSVPAVLQILEASTVNTVQFKSLTLAQNAQRNFTLEASAVTDSFDSVLFQRGIYEADKKITAVALSNVEVEFTTDTESLAEAAQGKTVLTIEATVVPSTLSAGSSTPATPVGPSVVAPTTQPSSLATSSASSTPRTTAPAAATPSTTTATGTNQSTL